jgi:hypothetical protein
MVTRREFVEGGVAITLIATAVPITAASTSPGSALGNGAAYYKVLFDPHFQASRQFAAHADTLGAPVHATGANVTDLWYADLYHRWQRGPAAIAGMTVYPAFFALEMMARDAGLRVTYRAEHQVRDGVVKHQVSASRSTLVKARQLTQAGDLWASRVADLIMSSPQRRTSLLKCSLTTHRTTTIENDESLVSFVLAPGNNHRNGAV